MCTDAIFGLMIPSIIMGMILCSMIFTIIIKRSDRLRNRMEEGDESTRMLLHSFLVVEPVSERRSSGTSRPEDTMKSGYYMYKNTKHRQF